ncbi:MAG: hypothetical protein H7175_25860, partial [Burkholderiales bacterium]|nr:hypothetical protein [Anaerolineae bacterium]
HIGTYARGLSGETQKVFFTGFNGKSFEVGPELSEVPALVRSAEYFTGVIPASPNLPPNTAGWILRQSDQMAPVDVDNDGRAEIMIFANQPDEAGNNRMGLLRWRDGGLYLDWVVEDYPIINTWRILNPDRPLVFGSGVVIYGPANAGGTQFAFLVWGNGSLVLANPSGNTMVGPTGNWTINLGSASDPTQFVAADLDGSGRKLVILEHVAAAPPVAYRTRTMVTVLDFLPYLFRFNSRVEITLGGYQFKLDRPAAVVSRFGPSGSVDSNREDVVVLGTTVSENIRTEGNTVIISYPERYYLKILRWDTAARNFVTASSSYAETIPAVSGPKTWPMDKNDRLVVISEQSRAIKSLILVSPTRSAAAVLRYNSGNFQVISHREGGITAADTTGQTWNFAENDLLMSAQLLTDNTSELLVIRPDLRLLGIVGVKPDAGLALKWLSPGRTIQPPGARGAQGWLISPNTRYLIGDLNGDGYDEITAFTAQPDSARLALLRPVPDDTGIDSGNSYDDCGPRGITDTTINSIYSRAALDQRRQAIADAYAANSYIDMTNGVSHKLEETLYLDEAYYFVAIELALRLNESGQYSAALNWIRTAFDYARLPANPIIAAKLAFDAGQPNFTRRLNWLQDTLNPHAIAEIRRNSYIRYTLLTLVRCLLDFADAEFTRATSESVPRARELYLEALELLGLPQINQHSKTCSDLIGTLEIQVGTDEERWIWLNLQKKLAPITLLPLLSATIERVTAIMETDEPLLERYESASRLIDGVVEAQTIPTFERVLDANSAARRETTLAMLADESTALAISELGRHVAESDSDIKLSPAGYWEVTPAPIFPFCIPPNRVVDGLRRHAQLNLQKIRACQNIAGMELRLDPYALPTLTQAATDENGLPIIDRETLPPLPYRYGSLIERAKQLVDLARQMEASMLSFIESADRARYDEIKARQDMSLAMAGVRLHDLQLSEAVNSVTLAEIQRSRASAATRHYRELVNQGLSALEIAALASQATAIALEVAGLYSLETFLEWAGAGAPIAAQTANLLSSSASYERRAQEWSFQHEVSIREEAAAQQQVRLAQDRTQIAAQERAVAAMQAENAEELLNFIALKRFGSSILYEWMSGVLEGIYRFFLQQATTMAKLAQAQLAFERQEIPPAYIKADYWEPQSSGLTPDLSLPALAGDSQTPNLRGLTGSARLLRDIFELDQYAFTTNRRKLQLSETISLSQYDPYAFQRFRENGVLRFATPITLFDAKFPGHYLRLIRQVRTTLIALIPPVDGIRATLGTVGISRVVIGPDNFQTVAIERGPESVALTSPTNATGLFEMDIQPELLVPFEGIGVDTNWEFRLPKFANRFDYNTIADVLITIEYTALDSADYRQQVLETTSRTVSSDRAFSFRHHFADQWWDLHNPDQAQNPLRTIIQITNADFPANLDDLAIQAATLYFSFKQGQALQLGAVVMDYSIVVQGAPLRVGPYTAAPINGVISSRQGNWPAISNRPVAGMWDLRFATTPAAEQV